MKTPTPHTLFAALSLAATLLMFNSPAFAETGIFSGVVDVSKITAGTKSITSPGLISQPSSPVNCLNGVDYQPLEPFEVFTFTDRVVSNDVVSYTQVPWPTKTSDINTKLPNISTEIGSSTLTTKGNIWLLEGSKKSQSIVIDFMKYRSEQLQEPSGQQPATPIYARVGVGMRIFITLNSGTISFAGSLQSLAVAVSKSNVTGTISAQLIGINAPEVTQAMPFTSDLSDASVQRIIEAMAVIKSRLSDDNAVLRPQLLAKITCRQN